MVVTQSLTCPNCGKPYAKPTATSYNDFCECWKRTTTTTGRIDPTDKLYPPVLDMFDKKKTQGWQCPACKTIYAPHVDCCECEIGE